MSNDAGELIRSFLIDHRPHGRNTELPVMPRSESTSEFQPLEDKEVEYFFASDASAVIEHTNRVIFLEVNTLRSFLLIKAKDLSQSLSYKKLRPRFSSFSVNY